MAKRSSGRGLGLVVGGLVLIALVPREFWIALGVVIGIALVAYAAIKLIGAKHNSVPHANAAQTPPRHEPTLAELTATNLQRKRVTRLPPASPEIQTIAPIPPVKGSDPKLAGQSANWREAHGALADENRRRAEQLRNKFPPSSGQNQFPQHPWQQLSTKPDVTSNLSAGSQIASLQENEQLSEQGDALASDFIEEASGGSENNLLAEIVTPDANPQITGEESHQFPAAALKTDADSAFTSGGSDPYVEDQLSEVDHKPERSLGNFMRFFRRPSETDDFYNPSAEANRTPSQSHAIPAAPVGYGQTRWFKPGEAVEIAGLILPGGMIYVGPKLEAANGMVDDPALISPHLNVARTGDFRERHTEFWPSYKNISPTARRAYLTWLSEGRSHPDCDIGLVFLFFYGLERRVLFDATKDETAKREWPAILVEIRRLLSVYGDKSGSFKRYASELLSWVELDGASGRLYEQPVPEFERTYELPPYMRLALGQASQDRSPLPAAIALSWLRLSPDCYLRTAATRCPKEFAQLFGQRYHDVLGAGLVLPKNRTKLKFVYQPASLGFQNAKVTMGFGDIPDVTALTAPIRTLREIGDQCTDELGSYSRLVGKDPALAGTLESLLLLPASLWPAAPQARLRELTGRMRDGRIALTLRELLAAFGGAKQPFTRDRVRGLARALEGEQIGMEPHVLAGAKAPNEGDTVVLFAQPLTDAIVGSGVDFQTAALTLQLAAAMAQADGDFSEKEIAHLRSEIEGWAHLNTPERCRLHAHLEWLIASPPTLVALKKKLEPLPVSAREIIARFMATVAQSDGFVSPDEVKFLEKVYKALGVETKRVFSDVHAASSAKPGPMSTKVAEKQGFRLDAAKIAGLQEDTARVAALLSTIFTEDSPSPVPIPEPELVIESAAPSPLGLDEAHSALLRLMLSRPSWTRTELEDAATDLELMLDGALEQINEAAFDAFDAPVCEGDDPVEVNLQLLEKI